MIGHPDRHRCPYQEPVHYTPPPWSLVQRIQPPRRQKARDWAPAFNGITICLFPEPLGPQRVYRGKEIHWI
jgi:hypothetical protein